MKVFFLPFQSFSASFLAHAFELHISRRRRRLPMAMPKHTLAFLPERDRELSPCHAMPNMLCMPPHDKADAMPFSCLLVLKTELPTPSATPFLLPEFHATIIFIAHACLYCLPWTVEMTYFHAMLLLSFHASWQPADKNYPVHQTV